MGRKLPHFLADDEPERLLEAATRQRDRLLVLTLLALGLRVSELCKLEVPDIDFRRRSVFIRAGKGDKDRYLPLPKILLGPLRGWVGKRQAGPVFPSSHGGKPLTSRAIQLLLRRLAKKAKLPGWDQPRRANPHKLRHAMATRTLEAGATIFDVKELLGHSSIATTQVYLSCTPQRLAEVVDRVYE